jgi:hypothetical protein
LSGKGAPPITEQFSSADRERFHNLLKLAAESPFAGERDNALAAARRLAERFGMTLQEAAADVAGRHGTVRPEPAAAAATPYAASTFARFFHLSEEALRRDKEAREASRQAAYARGLDAAEHRPSPGAGLFRRSSARRMDPLRHARNLLLETTLPLREIVRLTGLTVWQVVALKLKLRLDAGRQSRS